MSRPKKPCILVRNIADTQTQNCTFGQVRRILSGQPGAVANFHVVEVTAGSRHLHLDYDEAYYIFSGQGTLKSCGYEWELRAGTVVSIPAGIPHEISTEDGSKLTFLIVGSPAHRVDSAAFKPMNPDLLHPVARRKHARLDAFRKIDLYPVISSEFCNGIPPIIMLKMIADGGAKIVQLREKNMPLNQLLHLADAFRTLTDNYGMLLMINDRIDVALAVGADGVHIGQEDFPLPYAVRSAPHLLFGVSAHTPRQAFVAEQQGAGYVNLGPIYNTRTKTLSTPPVGPEIISEVAPRLVIPFTVMGGIKTCHIDGLVALGAKRIAMVTEITQADNPCERTAELCQMIRSAIKAQRGNSKNDD